MKPLASCANKRISATKMWSSKKLPMWIDIEFSVAVCSFSFIRSCHNSSSPLSQLFSSYICWELDSEMWNLLLQMWANPAWLTWPSQLQSNACSMNTITVQVRAPKPCLSESLSILPFLGPCWRSWQSHTWWPGFRHQVQDWNKSLSWMLHVKSRCN